MNKGKQNIPPDDFLGLCEDCSKMAHIMVIGECDFCNRPTPSQSYQRCRTCAHNDQKCMSCGVELTTD